MPAIQPPKLGRLLFPNEQPHLQRRGLRHFYFALIVGVIIATACGTIMYRVALHS
jgi:hypothetical protein